MIEFSRSAVLRRWYFLSLILVLIILVILRLTKLAPSEVDATGLESIASIIDNLIAGTLTSLIIGAAYVLLFPTAERNQYEIVRSRDIAQVIEEECHGAREWSVKSRAANYFTTITLSSIVQDALKTGRSVRVRIQTIDPMSDSLLQGYSNSMRDIKSRVGKWSVDRARIEVYASILRAALTCQEAPRVDLQFGLSGTLWVTSIDYSDRSALITCQNKGADAMLFRSDSEFYASFTDDFNASWLLCRLISPKIECDFPTFQNLSPSISNSIREFFKGLEIAEPDDDQIMRIVGTLTREHDYA